MKASPTQIRAELKQALRELDRVRYGNAGQFDLPEIIGRAKALIGVALSDLETVEKPRRVA